MTCLRKGTLQLALGCLESRSGLACAEDVLDATVSSLPLLTRYCPGEYLVHELFDWRTGGEELLEFGRVVEGD